MLSTVFLEPVDLCGCGDEGYLSVRTLPIDLAHGVGKIHQVPVYHCRSGSCQEYTLPESVSRRLEILADKMEAEHSFELQFCWPEPTRTNGTANATDNTVATSDHAENSQESLVQAFTLPFINREYEDARVVFVAPGLAIFLQSNLDRSEFYLLRYEPESLDTGIQFSFLKFYADEPQVDFASILAQDADVYLKELAVLALEEIEDSLNYEFGAVSE